MVVLGVLVVCILRNYVKFIRILVVDIGSYGKEYLFVCVREREYKLQGRVCHMIIDKYLST